MEVDVIEERYVIGRGIIRIVSSKKYGHLKFGDKVMVGNKKYTICGVEIISPIAKVIGLNLMEC